MPSTVHPLVVVVELPPAPVVLWPAPLELPALPFFLSDQVIQGHIVGSELGFPLLQHCRVLTFHSLHFEFLQPFFQNFRILLDQGWIVRKLSLPLLQFLLLRQLIFLPELLHPGLQHALRLLVQELFFPSGDSFLLGHCSRRHGTALTFYRLGLLILLLYLLWLNLLGFWLNLLGFWWLLLNGLLFLGLLVDVLGFRSGSRLSGLDVLVVGLLGSTVFRLLDDSFLFLRLRPRCWLWRHWILSKFIIDCDGLVERW